MDGVLAELGGSSAAISREGEHFALIRMVCNLPRLWWFMSAFEFESLGCREQDGVEIRKRFTSCFFERRSIVLIGQYHQPLKIMLPFLDLKQSTTLHFSYYYWQSFSACYLEQSSVFADIQRISRYMERMICFKCAFQLPCVPKISLLGGLCVVPQLDL